MAERKSGIGVPVKLMAIAAVLLGLAACAGAVSAQTVTVGSVNIVHMTDPPVQVPITLDSAPAGVAGYQITVTADPTVLSIVDVKFPDRMNADFATFDLANNAAVIKVADVNDVIPPAANAPSAPYVLAYVVVQGVTAGSSADLTATVNEMDADDGTIVTPAVANGKIGVELPSGAIQVTVTDKRTGGTLPGATISVSPVDGVSPQSIPRTDATGSATISGFIPGQYSVTVGLDGYATPAASPVIVTSGQTAPVSFALVQMGSFKVFSKPVTSGAEIWIDGRDTGKATTAAGTAVPGYEPAPATHTMTLTLVGYSCGIGSYQTTPGGTKAVTLTMTRQTNEIPGIINVDSSPQQARVYVNGEDTGYDTPASVSVSPGENMVDVGLDGYVSQGGLDITIGEAETRNLFFTLEPSAVPIPEFPTLAVPLVTLLGLSLLVVLVRARRRA